MNTQNLARINVARKAKDEFPLVTTVPLEGFVEQANAGQVNAGSPGIFYVHSFRSEQGFADIGLRAVLSGRIGLKLAGLNHLHHTSSKKVSLQAAGMTPSNHTTSHP